jgi:hypothetical protein
LESATNKKTTAARLTPVLAVILILGCASASQATFAVKIWEDNNAPATFSQATGGTINLNGSNAAYPDFSFSGFGVTSNSNVADTQAKLTSTGTINPSQIDGLAHTLTILVSDNNFTFPPGASYLLQSSESYSELFTGSTDNYKFQSFVTPGANLFDMTHTASPGFLFSNIGGTGSGSNNEANISFGTTLPFTMTQELVINLSNPIPTVTGFQPTGSSVVTAQAVPEPASLTMALIGVGSVGIFQWIRRRRQRAQV